MEKIFLKLVGSQLKMLRKYFYEMVNLRYFNSGILDWMFFNLVFIIPSFRLMDKFGYLSFCIPYTVVMNVVYLSVKRESLSISKKKLWVIFGVFCFLVAAFFYPKISLRSNPGSTADDAMILASNTLRTTGKLYDVYIDANVPISPGPGWILMNSGFSLFNVYFLFGATYIAILLATIRFFRYSNSFLNLFCLFLGISLVFWELLLNGHDFLPVSIAFFILFLIVFKNLMATTKIWKVLLIGILLGLVSTSRIVFIAAPVLFAFILMQFHRKNAALLLLFAFVTNISLNLYYYSINDFFQPIHILGKAQRLLGMNLLFFVTVLGLGVLFFLSKTTQADLAKIAKRIALVLAAFLLPVAYFDLFRLHFDFAVWEGANYLMPLSPFFIYYLCASYSELKT